MTNNRDNLHCYAKLNAKNKRGWAYCKNIPAQCIFDQENKRMVYACEEDSYAVISDVMFRNQRQFTGKSAFVLKLLKAYKARP